MIPPFLVRLMHPAVRSADEPSPVRLCRGVFLGFALPKNRVPLFEALQPINLKGIKKASKLLFTGEGRRAAGVLPDAGVREAVGRG